MSGQVVFVTFALPEDGGVLCGSASLSEGGGANRGNGNVLHDGMYWNG